MGVSLWSVFTAAAAATIALVLWHILGIYKRLRYWHVPGPFSPLLVGHLFGLRKRGSMWFVADTSRKYGPVFKVWFGSRMFVVITDPQIARSVMYKNINHARFINVMSSHYQKVDDAGLVAARDGYWKLVRNAWQPAFGASSLEGYMSIMDSSAMKLVDHLRAAAAAGQAVNMHPELGKMTLQVVGSSAYGVDFGTMGSEEAVSDEQKAGRRLAMACENWFSTASIMNGSVYFALSALIPSIASFVAAVAAVFPDAPMKKQLAARDVIISASKQLIGNWKTGSVSGSPRIPAYSGTAAGTEGVAPGSFLDLMLSARDKQTGQQLTDLQVLAQTQTFILAGYETTANALAYALYCIANNPRVEEKLLREIQTLDKSKPLTCEAVEQLPYVDAVIQETLRLYPPASATTRELKEDSVVGGYWLPAGTPIMISMFTMHRSPKYFKQPESFIPERFLPGHEELASQHPYAHAPFGTGSRMCIGYKFALQEAKVALVRLYQHYTFKLLPGQVPLKLRNGITMSPADGIWCQPVPRG